MQQSVPENRDAFLIFANNPLDFSGKLCTIKPYMQQGVEISALSTGRMGGCRRAKEGFFRGADFATA